MIAKVIIFKDSSSYFIIDFTNEMLLSPQSIATKSLKLENIPSIVKFEEENEESMQTINRICEKPSEAILIPLIKKFIYILKKSTGFYKLKSMTEASFLLINDLTYFTSKNDIKARNVKNLKIF